MPSGQVQALGVGDTALVARYRAEPVVALVLVPRRGAEPFPEVEPSTTSSTGTSSPSCGGCNIHPAELCDDATFLRRVSLDVTGAAADARRRSAPSWPTTTPDKRPKKIDELLGRPGYAALWATKFCDLLRPSGFDGHARLHRERPSTRRFYEWLRARLQENTPYDQLAERILLATSREGRSAQEWVRGSAGAAGGERGQDRRPEGLRRPPDARPVLAADQRHRRQGHAAGRPRLPRACGWSAPSAIAIRTTSGSRTIC